MYADGYYDNQKNQCDHFGQEILLGRSLVRIYYTRPIVKVTWGLEDSQPLTDSKARKNDNIHQINFKTKLRELQNCIINSATARGGQVWCLKNKKIKFCECCHFSTFYCPSVVGGCVAPFLTISY